MLVILQNNNIDVCCITETWLNNDIPTEAVDIEGFVCHRCDRKDGRQGGGVACYVRQDLPFSLVTPVDDSDVESLWLIYRQPRMPRSVSHIIFGVVYHPPDAKSYATTNHIIDNVDAILRQHSYARTVIVGDFNKMTDKPLRDLKLKQIVHAATRQSATLDKIYTNLDEWYRAPCVLPSIGQSDHQAVVLLPVDGGRRPLGQRVAVTVRSSDPNSKAQLARTLADFDWSSLNSMASTQEMTTYFYDVTTSMLDHFLPTHVTVRHSTDKPWITDEFRRLIRKRQHAWTNNDTVAYKRLRNSVNRLSNKLRKRFYERRLDGLRHCDSTNWWRQIKQLTGQTTKSDLSGLANIVTNGNMQQLADNINASLITVSDDLTRLTEHSTPVVPPGECDYVISPYEVFMKLERINIRKAPGPDGLPNWFIRDFAFAIAEPLCLIFNASIRQGVVPTVWKQANVVAVPKIKPPKTVEQDLRPISLTPTISKIFESLVGRWILGTISNKFDKQQFGAIKGRSTCHALIDMTHKWHHGIG